MNNVQQRGQNHSDNVEQYGQVVVENSRTNTTDTSAERLSSSTPFNLTDRLQIFTYLTTPNRVRWYRVIMRFFLHSHRELYRYQLTAQEIRDMVRSTFDPEYSLEQCQNDLAALKEWGNVSTMYDSSRATSIASFLSPALLYQATPEAIAIETFLEEQTWASAGMGSLRQGDITRLAIALQRLDEALALSELSNANERDIAEQWQQAFEVWNTMAREAAQYLAAMTIVMQQGRPELEAYQAYKGAVVAYVHGFAQALTQNGRLIREMLVSWNATGKAERLVEITHRYLEPPTLATENRRTPEELQQEVRNQIDAVTGWFAAGSNADAFRRNALSEVDKVVRLAAMLVANARPNANYASTLAQLAGTLAEARDGESAQQLFSLAFANLLPTHLPESLAGVPTTLRDGAAKSVWQEAPTVSLHLRPVNRATRVDFTAEDPITDTSKAAQELIAKQEESNRLRQEQFTHLFATPQLDIGTMKRISIEERTILMNVIDSCLATPHHQYRAPDGSIIRLLNPQERTYAFLRATDGVLLLPRYRLQRQEEVMRR